VHPQILVWRFWTSYNAHLKLGPDHEFVDPVRTMPLTSLAIVAVGVIVQCVHSGGRLNGLGVKLSRILLRIIPEPLH